MHRQLAAILLLFAFATHTFNQVAIVLNYYVNTASFAKVCENKARPMMHCNGKCQMMKKLKEEEKKDQQTPERKSENRAETVLYANSPALLLSSLFYTEVKDQLSSLESTGKCVDRSFDFFHPPKIG